MIMVNNKLLIIDYWDYYWYVNIWFIVLSKLINGREERKGKICNNIKDFDLRKLIYR